MLLILIGGTLAVVAAVLGLSMCHVAALSDCNSAVALTEWIAASRLPDRHLEPTEPTDRAGEQFPFTPPGETFREAG